MLDGKTMDGAVVFNEETYTVFFKSIPSTTPRAKFNINYGICVIMVRQYGFISVINVPFWCEDRGM